MLSSGSIQIVTTAEGGRWHEVLESCHPYDFYHLPEYHSLAEESSEGGEGVLFVYKEGARVAAWPFILRQTHKVPGLERAGIGYRDGTSVYGYAGPISNPQAMGDSDFACRFVTAIAGTARDLNLVTLFSRLHPLLDNRHFALGLGIIKSIGATVSIDLTQPLGQQWEDYRKAHRYDIRRGRKAGIQIEIDDGWTRFEDFYQLYLSTMRRRSASGQYFFNRQYFFRLRDALGGNLKLFHAMIDGQVISSALFVQSGEFLHYHLSGSDAAYSRLAPSKLVVDEARLWGVASGLKTLHLGGGVGGKEDSLFGFKCGFSNRHHEFFVWHHVAIPDVNRDLLEARRDWLSINLPHVEDADFFPRYRHGYEEAPYGILGRTPLEGVAKMQGKLTRVLIIGTGGHARVIADALRDPFSKSKGFDVVGFLDDNPHSLNTRILDLPVLGSLADLESISHDAVVIGIDDNEQRSHLFSLLASRGEKFATVIHPSAVIGRNVRLGAGTVVLARVVVDTCATVDDNVILNVGCTIGYDCAVGSNSHICSGVHLGGAVHVGRGSWIGMGSAILPEITIGQWAIVDSKAVVIKDVPSHATVTGVPAVLMAMRSDRHKVRLYSNESVGSGYVKSGTMWKE